MSETCVHLPYGQKITLSALARCYPHRPILSLWDDKQREVAATEDDDIVKEEGGAHTTFVQGDAYRVGIYSFRLQSRDINSAIEVIGIIQLRAKLCC